MLDVRGEAQRHQHGAQMKAQALRGKPVRVTHIKRCRGGGAAGFCAALTWRSMLAAYVIITAAKVPNLRALLKTSAGGAGGRKLVKRQTWS